MIYKGIVNILENKNWHVFRKRGSAVFGAPDSVFDCFGNKDLKHSRELKELLGAWTKRKLKEDRDRGLTFHEHCNSLESRMFDFRKVKV